MKGYRWNRYQRKHQHQSAGRRPKRLSAECLEERRMMAASGFDPPQELEPIVIPPPPVAEYATGHILVRFRDGKAAQAIAPGSRMGDELGLVPGLHEVELDGIAVEAAIKAYRENPDVLYADVDYYMTSLAAQQRFPGQEPQVPDIDITDYIPPSVTPPDPQFGQQWALHNMGQTVQAIAGTPDADIDAPQAWAVTTGHARTTVAVIDWGVDYTHPDLYLNIWLNENEIPAATRDRLQDTDGDQIITFYDLNHPLNTNTIFDLNHNGYIDGGDVLFTASQHGWADGIDTDGNGYVDDLIGWDFKDNDNNPMDTTGHGTGVAGIIGAMGNNLDAAGNAVGVAGINWQVRLMPLRMESVKSSIRALNYAVASGAAISNNSYGYKPTWWDQQQDNNSNSGTSQVFRDAIRHAGQQGHIFVAAAGNDGNHNTDSDSYKQYPADFDLANMITVAATDPLDNLVSIPGWWSSNYGTDTVHVAAPGLNVRTTAPGSQYTFFHGTSAAAPHVAGVVALVQDLHPDWSHEQVIQRVLGSADRLPSLAGKVRTGGRLNAAMAVALGPKVVGTSFIGSSLGGAVQASGLLVTFDEPVNPFTFTAADVRLEGIADPPAVTVQAVAGSDLRRYHLSWQPISIQPDVAKLRVTIGPDLENLHGRLMNQDRDARLGEPLQDVYSVEFSGIWQPPIEEPGDIPPIDELPPRPPEIVVHKLYNQVLDRDPEPSGLEYWSSQLEHGTSTLGALASGIFESSERLDPIIAGMYREFLLRDTDAAGLAYWRDQVWKRDGGPDNVVAGMISSAEFYASAGGTDRGWISQVYRRLLGREADAEGLDYWTGVLARGLQSRMQVVLGFVRSEENFRNLVQAWHLAYLGRQATEAEQAELVGRLKSGASQRDIQIQLLDSPEYRLSPPRPDAEPGAYAALLNLGALDSKS